jgi:DNA-binding beta-propeller fold protein YncE
VSCLVAGAAILFTCGSTRAQAPAVPAPVYPAVATTDLLTPQAPISVSAGGSFDYMVYDHSANRIVASHPGAKGLVVLDLATMTAREIDLGAEVNGVAVDRKDGLFFTAGGGGKLFVLDDKTLAQKSELDLPGPADGILFDSDNGMLYVDNDESTNCWVIDAKSVKIVATIAIHLAGESMAYDSATKLLYHNIKRTNEIQVIDTATNTVTASWPTAPMTSPHGLVFDKKSDRLFSAGKNHLLIAVDAKTGAIVGSTPLASGVDQIAFDAASREIFCPGGGSLTIVKLDDAGNPTTVGQIAIDKGAHTIAIDRATHNVWICYPGTATTSFVQEFTPKAS